MSEIAGQNAIIYARVSTDPEDTGQVVSTQERELRDYCARKGLNIVGYYSDEGQTGSDLVRPGIGQALMHIMSQRNVQWLIARDSSRFTRNGELKEIQQMIAPLGCQVRFASDDMDMSSIGARITAAVKQEMDKEENIVRNRNTVKGMRTRKLEGKHVGRPAAFMFYEDLDTAPKGRYKRPYEDEDGVFHPGTKLMREEELYQYAREGRSLWWVSENILGISYHTLESELMPREAEPQRRLRDRAKFKTNPTEEDYVYYYQNKGTKDRYSVYMTLYAAAIEQRKGFTEERVGKTDEITEERVEE